MTKPCWTACWFQHTAARRRLDKQGSISEFCQKFQHTAARRRLGRFTSHQKKASLFQHTAARRRLVITTGTPCPQPSSFNTQPPEGGWSAPDALVTAVMGFNTQPPEGGWMDLQPDQCLLLHVSTHSRPKAAGATELVPGDKNGVSTHSRPKAAGKGCRCKNACPCCFNTQPPEGGWRNPIK